MFDVGRENKALDKMWKQLPKRKGKPIKMVGKVLAGDLLPRKKSIIDLVVLQRHHHVKRVWFGWW
jgi:carbonic anhydrase